MVVEVGNLQFQSAVPQPPIGQMRETIIGVGIKARCNALAINREFQGEAMTRAIFTNGQRLPST
jgi:hypothetical protein